MPESAAISSPRFIDLHSHTTASDGSFTPAELVGLAKRIGLAALAITDHDTFGGYEQAASHADAEGLDLVRGIELNSRLAVDQGGSVAVHMLGYFPAREPSQEFLAWLSKQRDDRRSRNRRLIEALQNRGVDITLNEVEARGRSLSGRTHFAQILVEKGYAQNTQDAFRRFIGEDAPSYVERQSLSTAEVVRIIRDGGGIPAVAHPVRLRLPRETERGLLANLKASGLLAIEVYHSDHPPELQAYYHELAQELALLPTGGSDFHGAAKPGVSLGTGLRGNIRVPFGFLQGLRQLRA